MSQIEPTPRSEVTGAVITEGQPIRPSQLVVVGKCLGMASRTPTYYFFGGILEESSSPQLKSSIHLGYQDGEWSSYYIPYLGYRDVILSITKHLTGHHSFVSMHSQFLHIVTQNGNIKTRVSDKFSDESTRWWLLIPRGEIQTQDEVHPGRWIIKSNWTKCFV